MRVLGLHTYVPAAAGPLAGFVWGPQLLQSTVNNGSTGFQLTMIGWFLSDDRAAYVYVRGHIMVAYTSMLWGKETEAKASYVRRPSGRWMEIERHRILLHRPIAISAVRRSRLGTYMYPGDRWQAPRAKARNGHVASCYHVHMYVVVSSIYGGALCLYCK